ncbi:hypothetical protein HPB50_005342 [Hyalomma asiaticum]|uniref:Uncharacterized protein n=1 Tax=Hyalomma asiaticum TaxID=266040 RepID=A0ACB7SJN4_HYAAI|nr:hypothetical protein HPB50_005342 [Hyalomma asiaticum]
MARDVVTTVQSYGGFLFIHVTVTHEVGNLLIESCKHQVLVLEVIFDLQVGQERMLRLQSFSDGRDEHCSSSLKYSSAALQLVVGARCQSSHRFHGTKDYACTTPRNPSPCDTNETRRPQDVSALAADVAESTGNSVPWNEVLLQNALLVMQNLAGALQNNAQAAPQSARPRVKLDMPSYSGYHDSKSANEYLNRLLHYQQATGLTDAELLARAVPVSLTEQAARWFQLAGHRARTPRCAWNGGATTAQARRGNTSATFADEQVPRGWELSDRALDPYAYALRTAHDSLVRDAPRQEHEADTRPGVRHATERRSYDPPVHDEQRPGQRVFSGRCYQCGAMGHTAHECRRTPVQEQTRGSGNGRGST